MTSYFSGSLDSLFEYWNRRYRAKKFTQLSTRKKAVETIYEKISSYLNKINLWVDVGAGAGSVINHYLSKGLKITPVAIDFSFAMIESFLNPDIERIVADGRKSPLKKDSVDFISSFFVWSDYPSLNKPLKEFYKLLKKRGYALIVDYASGDSYWELRKMLHGFKDIVGNINLRTPKEVEELMKKIGFKVIKAEYISYQVPFDAMPQLITSTDLALMKFENPDFYQAYRNYYTKQVHARRFYYVLGQK